VRSLWLPKHHAYIRFHDLPGAGPAVVMLHGLGSAASADFPAIAHHPDLSRCRFILPDFLGFGFSDRPGNFEYSLQAHAETICAILHYLNLGDVYLFGHSMGGTIAIALAASHPELVRRLVLAEANLDPGKGEISKIIADQPEREYVTHGHGTVLEELRHDCPDASSLATYAGTVGIADPTAMHRSASGLIRGMAPSQRDIFLFLDIPRAFIFGERSLPDPDLDRLRSAGITVLTVPDAGHAMMADNPGGFALVLRAAFELK
jgi:pimeloyl-ACP methyl ester carboxylesterase